MNAIGCIVPLKYISECMRPRIRSTRNVVALAKQLWLSVTAVGADNANALQQQVQDTELEKLAEKDLNRTSSYLLAA
ncbi:toxin-antitoxin system, antitoxin component, Xre domain protein [Ostertagia ostertagi]